ncbi:MAG TPA: pitrilysin family protein [Candidatus Polarisedimenticolaceae bacterium]|nr:pitrilysin family protein [Candidatus Polarisedimenticolaceae bacterium]
MIRKETFDNGLTLLTERMPDVRSVSIGVWLRQGSRSEPPEINGISHFIEHLVFKGTKRRTARQIALTMDALGGHMDAFTSKEYTCFYAKVLDEHVPAALELLADIVQRPRFDPAELERERKVILEEIRMVEDTPDELLYDLFVSHFYPSHPLGRPIQGTERSVAGMSRRQLLGFFRHAYRPANMLISAAGHVDHAATAARVRRVFRQLRPGPPPDGPNGSPRASWGVVRRDKRELEQVHLLLGVPAYPERFEHRYSLYVLNTILGGTMSSRLFHKIRERRGLAYSVYSAVNAFLDAGFLTIYAATSPKNAEEVVRLVVHELADLRDHGPTAQELRVAKEHLKGSLMLSLESTSARMSNLARQEIYFGKRISAAETLRRLQAVGVRDVRTLAGQMLREARLGLAAVGRVRRLRLRQEALRL